MRRLAFALALFAVPVPALAQDRAATLADIRQELSVLWVEIQRLNQQLSTTGGPQTAVPGGDVQARQDAIEAELRRLAGLTEQLQLRIDSVVRDGTTRIGDLEFRLCELESDCDIGSLGETPSLGGVAVEGAATALPPAGGSFGGGATGSGGGELAVAEQSDFDRAQAAYDAGDYATAQQLFGAFTETYPGGPLSAEAHFLRGEAAAANGDWSTAARAYLDGFSGSPDSPRAPMSLTRLGTALAELGQVSEACLTLAEVERRYPGTPAVADAQRAMAGLSCN
ncbi:tol-pal system protein YbgF [Rhodobacterales bacterium HKCCE2091]|nr:tol-pal system protein YbgF [Rhodobacterales bacterium HKCCE2091]